MSDREYYLDRKNLGPRLTLKQLKRLFLTLYNNMSSTSTSYGQFYYANLRIWKPDPGTYILTHLRLDNVWPIKDHIHEYDEATLFTIIEFLYDYVRLNLHPPNFESVPQIRKAKRAGQSEFQKKLNEIMKGYDKGYVISKKGEITELVPVGLSKLVESTLKTHDSDNIDKRVLYAVNRFLKYGASNEEKKDAIRTLGDVLEYLKKSNFRLDTKDEKTLFQILNKFAIRHHDKSQLDNYDKEDFFEYVFYILLASIRFLSMRLLSDKSS